MFRRSQHGQRRRIFMSRACAHELVLTCPRSAIDSTRNGHERAIIFVTGDRLGVSIRWGCVLVTAAGVSHARAALSEIDPPLLS